MVPLVEIVKNTARQIKKLSLRTKVIVVFLIIMAFFGYRISFSARYYIVDLQGQENVNESLRAAHGYFYNHIDRFDSKINGMSREAGHLGAGEEVFRHLFETTRTWDPSLRPDVFVFIDTGGNIVYSSNRKYDPIEKQVVGRRFRSLQSVQKALAGLEVKGLEILPTDLLKEERILDKSKIQVIPTKEATSPSYNVLEKALTVVSAQPVYVNGKLAGAFIGGQVRNNKHDIVDLVDRDFHTRATIFLDNVRISTTVPNNQGQRAVGTLLSDAVGNTVLKQGQPYKSRAFVVNDWYITAYEPIRDLQNRVVGALYVGVMEAPLLAKQAKLENEIKGTLFVLTLVFVLALYYLYRSIVVPIQKMSAWALGFARDEANIFIPTQTPNRCWEVKECEFPDCPVYGKYHIKCWLVPRTPCCGSRLGSDKKDVCRQCKVYKLFAGNEIEHLADAFVFMAASIQEHTDSLHQLNLELEQKNCELLDQKDELECQKEQLMALNEELEESMKALDDSQSIIYALAVAVEAKDPYTRGHSERVAEFSVKLAANVGIPSYQFSIIRGAALLHDIGKIGISGSILRKPSTLTAIEFQQVKKHPTIGERICSSLKFAKDMLPIIRHHHEHFNGRGYPDGLKEGKIPLMARIVAIADAFDAMTSDRPYRPGMTPEQAVTLLEAGSGSQWDPELIPIFITLIQEEIRETPKPENLEEDESNI